MRQSKLSSVPGARAQATSLRLLRLVAACIFATCLGGALRAAPQAFNVDIGDNVPFPLPSTAYGAAAAQPGIWNAVSANVATTPLVSTTGAATAATLTVTGVGQDASFQNADTVGNDELLLDDFQLIGASGNTTAWSFDGITNGPYEVWVYAWNPASPVASITDVTVLGGTGMQPCGGAQWAGNFVQGQHYVYDSVTVTATRLKIICTTAQGEGVVNGIQIRPVCNGNTQQYCTAKVNSLGCSPAISATGTPSASAGSGFVITGSNVINNKSGLLFYKANGTQQGIPFQGGSLCLGPSGIKRTNAMSSGGNPPPNDCSGVYSIDMNAYAVSAGPPIPDPALGMIGTKVNCQWWGRDPGFPAPNNTTLSDGLEYTVCP